MNPSPIVNVVADFFRRTTLHGFKYLCSRYSYDRCLRLAWLLICCASVCSAGSLCAVLWARFLQQPAIVALRDQPSALGMPRVILCLPAQIIADQVVGNFKEVANKSRLSTTLALVIRKKVVKEEQLVLLDRHLEELGIALPEALMKYSPECQDVVVSCRWQNHFLPSRKLFQKQFTDWGLCCVLDPVRLQNKTIRGLFDKLQMNIRLDFVVTCVNSSVSYYGCELLPVYEGVEDLEPHMLHRGMDYWMQVTYSTTVDEEGSLLGVDDGCVPDKGYSRILCIAKCVEIKCGCSDPLHPFQNADLPSCTAPQLNCLRSAKTVQKENPPCSCPPACTKFTTTIAVEASSLDIVNRTYDPLYQGINTSTSNAVHIRVRLSKSKTFYLLPTETWLTLLSSLGGVFNMFLGVGLFSALEFLFLIIFKLPFALKKSAEMIIPEPVHR